MGMLFFEIRMFKHFIWGFTFFFNLYYRCGDLLDSLRVDNLTENMDDLVISDNSYLKKSYIEHINNDHIGIQEMKRKLKELPEGYNFFLFKLFVYKNI